MPIVEDPSLYLLGAVGPNDFSCFGIQASSHPIIRAHVESAIDNRWGDANGCIDMKDPSLLSCFGIQSSHGIICRGSKINAVIHSNEMEGGIVIPHGLQALDTRIGIPLGGSWPGRLCRMR